MNKFWITLNIKEVKIMIYFYLGVFALALVGLFVAIKNYREK